MAELKTKATDQSAENFLQTVTPAKKQEESLRLLAMFEKATGEQAVMWGTSIVGFGKYHYKSERSRQEGDWPLVGFSPRKQNLTLYVITGDSSQNALLDRLGKHKTSVGCLYINSLADVDEQVLFQIVSEAYTYARKTRT